MNTHDFQANDISGKPHRLAEYRGKVVLVVNTASACGFTPQYAGLQRLYEKYGSDFVVLGFPCNQFGAQEPGGNAEIQNFCDTRFHVSFPMFEKIDVNGKDAHPLFQYLKKETPGILGSEAIKWNFTKFLIDRSGKPVKRFAPTAKPEDIEEDIRKLMAA
jgi:glutathione peroxidase